MKGEAYTRKEFDALPLGRAFEIVRAAHRVRVRWDHGRQLMEARDDRERVDRAADSVRRACDELGQAFDGTLERGVRAR